MLREILGSIKRGSRTNLSCPKCGGLVRKSDNPLGFKGLAALPSLRAWTEVISPAKYVCGKCGYSGFLAMEEEAEDKTEGE